MHTKAVYDVCFARIHVHSGLALGILRLGTPQSVLVSFKLCSLVQSKTLSYCLQRMGEFFWRCSAVSSSIDSGQKFVHL